MNIYDFFFDLTDLVNEFCKDYIYINYIKNQNKTKKFYIFKKQKFDVCN